MNPATDDAPATWDFDVLRARNAAVQSQIGNDGYFLYTAYNWEARDDRNTVRAVCFEYPDITDLHCWYASLTVPLPLGQSTQISTVSFNAKHENVQNYTQDQIDEQRIHGNVITTDPTALSGGQFIPAIPSDTGAVVQRPQPITSGSSSSNFRFDNYVDSIRVYAYDSSKPLESRWSNPQVFPASDEDTFVFTGAATLAASFALATAALAF